MSIKLIEIEGRQGKFLDLSALQTCPAELKQTPYWQVHNIAFESDVTIYSLSGRSKQAYRKDITCGFTLYSCNLHVKSDGTITVTNWTGQIVD